MSRCLKTLVTAALLLGIQAATVAAQGPPPPLPLPEPKVHPDPGHRPGRRSGST